MSTRPVQPDLDSSTDAEEVRDLERRLQEAYTELHKRDGEIQALRSSWSWRLTRPLRSLVDVFLSASTAASLAVPARSDENLAPSASTAAEIAVGGAGPIQTRPAEFAAPPVCTFLLLTDSVPTPDRDAGSYRTVQMLGLLQARGHRPAVGALRLPEESHPTNALEPMGIPFVAGEDAIEAYLQRIGDGLETVVLSRPEVALRWLFAVRALAPRARLVFDTVDLHWVRLQRQAGITLDPGIPARAERLRRQELFASQCSDAVLVVSEVERARLLEADQKLQVHVIPTIHPSPQGPLPGFSEREGLLFVGGFLHQPNVDAALYLARDVLPEVRRQLPEVVLTLAGSHMPAEVTALSSPFVRCLGHVPELEPCLRRARVFVAPLRYGAGLKGKIGQAMSWRIPVVTTTIGAEGFGVTPGREILVADTPAEFAAAVVALYTNPGNWASVADAAALHVEAHFSPSAVAERLDAAFPLSRAQG